MRRNNRFGYTLIELLIVVGILGLAGAILVPMLGNRGDFDTQAAVRRLIADLSFAQSDALANQEHRRLIFIANPDVDGQYIGWCLVRLKESEVEQTFNPDTAVYVQDPLAAIADADNYIVNLATDGRFGDTFIASVNLDSGQDFVTFDEFGGTVQSGGQPGSGGEIVVRGSSTVYRVTLDGVTGRITVEDITNDAGEIIIGG